MVCRNCGTEATDVFVDLGVQPPSNAYLRPEDLDRPEVFYPLRPVICPECKLVQLPVLVEPEEIFREYAYFSGQSESWVRHCDEYAVAMISRYEHLQPVLEIASNDGTLLRSFQRRGLRILGVEPARNVAWQAQLDGIPTISEFFGVGLAEKLKSSGYEPSLIVANNVLAHVPDLDDFLRGIALLLSPDGVVTFEVPHLARLIEDDQISQVYHEHLCYFGFITLQRCLYRRGLRAFDVEEIPVHGGSLRVYACRETSRVRDTRASVPQLSRREQECGYWDIENLAAYAERPAQIKRDALRVLAEIGPVVGYGAPAKFNTFANYLGLGSEMIPYVVDSTPAKQGTFLPGSRIPVLSPEVLTERRPETILLLAPNWEREMREKIARDCDWGPTVLCEPWKARKAVEVAA